MQAGPPHVELRRKSGVGLDCQDGRVPADAAETAAAPRGDPRHVRPVLARGIAGTRGRRSRRRRAGRFTGTQRDAAGGAAGVRIARLRHDLAVEERMERVDAGVHDRDRPAGRGEPGRPRRGPAHERHALRQRRHVGGVFFYRGHAGVGLETAQGGGGGVGGKKGNRAEAPDVAQFAAGRAADDRVRRRSRPQPDDEADVLACVGHRADLRRNPRGRQSCAASGARSARTAAPIARSRFMG